MPKPKTFTMQMPDDAKEKLKALAISARCSMSRVVVVLIQQARVEDFRIVQDNGKG